MSEGGPWERGLVWPTYVEDRDLIGKSRALTQNIGLRVLIWTLAHAPIEF